MKKQLIIFSHHYVDEFVMWNFNNVKNLNPDWDILPIGFNGYSLIEHSLVVDKSLYPINDSLIPYSPIKTSDWADPDLFIYESWRKFPYYEGYFLYEYDTVCNINISSFFNINVDFFGNNINNPANENWMWVELYRKFNEYSSNFTKLYGYGQSTCIYSKNYILEQCYYELIENKKFYNSMLSEIRGGTLFKKFCELIPSRSDINDFIWWKKLEIKNIKKEYFYHPIKNFKEFESIHDT
jgi:hypothetical protein